MNCPKCPRQELELVSVAYKDRSVPGPDKTMAKLDLERCPACGGMWFDSDELERYLDAGLSVAAAPAPAADPALDSKSGSCPKCGTALQRAPAPSNPRLAVDRCARCAGMWVDGFELDKASGKDLPLNERLKAMFGDLGKGGR